MIGRIIAKRFRITAPLGAGGMGSVWKAVHLTLGSPVAVKLIDDSLADNPEVLVRFQREAQASATLRSPHIVQIIDYGVDEGTPFIAMELLDGESLAERLERVGALGPEQTARIMTHVARAMAKAHEAGVIHRDLKPANIFLVRNDDDEVAKVLDFGIAKTQDVASGSATRTGSMIGTPAYMSPEQAQGTKTVDGRTDLWAMGTIAFECLTGRMVFEGTAVGELILQVCALPLPVPSRVADVPPGFDAWFARALDRDVEQRYQTPKEFIDSLRAVLGVSALASVSHGVSAGKVPTLRGLGDSGDAAVESARTVHSSTVEQAPLSSSSGSGSSSSSSSSSSLGQARSGTAGSFTLGPVGLPTGNSKGAFIFLGAALVLGVVGFLVFRGGGEKAASAVGTVAIDGSAASRLPTSAAVVTNVADAKVTAVSAAPSSEGAPASNDTPAPTSTPSGLAKPGSVRPVSVPGRMPARTPPSGSPSRPAAGDERVSF